MRQILLLSIALLAGCGGADSRETQATQTGGPIFGTLVIAGRTAFAQAFYKDGQIVVRGPGPDVVLPLSDITQASPMRIEWKDGGAVAEFVQ